MKILIENVCHVLSKEVGPITNYKYRIVNKIHICICTNCAFFTSICFKDIAIAIDRLTSLNHLECVDQEYIRHIMVDGIKIGIAKRIYTTKREIAIYVGLSILASQTAKRFDI